MKRILAALLAAALSLSLAIPASAAAPAAATVTHTVTAENPNNNGNWYSDLVTAEVNDNTVTLEVKVSPGTVIASGDTGYNALNTLNGKTDGPANDGSAREFGLRINVDASTKYATATKTGSCSDVVYFALDDATGIYTNPDIADVTREKFNPIVTAAGSTSPTAKYVVQYLPFATKVAGGWRIDEIENGSTVAYTFYDKKGDGQQEISSFTLTVNVKYPEAPAGQAVTDPPYATMDHAKEFVTVNEPITTVGGAGTKDDPIVVKPHLTFTEPYSTQPGNAGYKGYWAGVHIQAPDGVSITTTGSNAAINGTGYVFQGLTLDTMAEQSSGSSFGVGVSGKNEISVYTSAAEVADGISSGTPSVFKPYFYIDWDGAGTKYSPVYYQIDLSDVTIKEAAQENVNPLPNESGSSGTTTVKTEVEVTKPAGWDEKKPVPTPTITLNGVNNSGTAGNTDADKVAQAVEDNGLGVIKAMVDVDVKILDGSTDVTSQFTPRITVNINPLPGPASGNSYYLNHFDLTSNQVDDHIATGVSDGNNSYNFTFEWDGTFSPFVVTEAKTVVPPPPPAPEPEPTPTPKPSTGGSYYWDGSVLVDIDQGLYGTVTPGIGYYQGWTTFTVHPNDGYEADYVMIDGKKQIAVNNNQFSINVTEPIRVTVTYKAAEALDISVEAPSAPDTTAPTANPQTGDSWFSNLFGWMF